MMVQTKPTRYIGKQFAAWKRVCYTFNKMGFGEPTDFNEAFPGHGNYEANIASQYQSDFTPSEVTTIIDFALAMSKQDLCEYFYQMSEREALASVLPHRRRFR